VVVVGDLTEEATPSLLAAGEHGRGGFRGPRPTTGVASRHRILLFTDPIVDSAADPYVVIHGDWFYYCHVIRDEAIYIRKARRLEHLGSAEAVLVWRPPPGMEYTESVWAPELFWIDDSWYVYFAAGERDEDYSHQHMYVLQGIGDDPQTASYSFLGKIADSTDQWAIDGTLLRMPTGKHYFIWSGREAGSRSQNLYIAPMRNPWTLEGERVCISTPTYPWEQHGLPVNEGPEVLPQGDRRHIIFSASHSLTDYYCLGQLTLVGDDPMNPEHWVKRPRPVFESHGGVIAPGHASFILTPDETSGWMIFHSARHAGSQWDRQVRLAEFQLRPDGSLYFLPWPRFPEARDGKAVSSP
jgi:GH43 family beta-xylosidase